MTVSARVLFLLDNFPGPTAGTEAQFWLLYRALPPDRYRPRVVTLRHSPYLAEHLPADQYHCLGIASLRDPAAIWRAARYVRTARREGFGVAHLFLNDVSVLMPPLLWAAGIRVIVSRRDLGFWYTPALLRILKFHRRFVDRVVANCGAVRDAVVAAEGYDRARVEVILNGCSPPANSPVPLGLRARHALGSGALLLGMVANLRPLKRVDDAIRALAGLRERRIDAALLVAGADVIIDGCSQKARLEALATELGVGGAVRFLGSLPSAWAFQDEIDVFLSCSDTEGLSNSIIEAMARGRPVVATAVGGTPELIRDGVTGYLYPPGDVGALTAAIERIAANPEHRRELGRAASAHAQRTVSLPALVAAHEHLYDTVAQGAGAARAVCP